MPAAPHWAPAPRCSGTTEGMKHHWAEACFVPDVSDGPAARRIADRFLELRGDDLVGGLVLRRFEIFLGAEVRTWWVDGLCASVTAHPDGPDRRPPEEVDLESVAPLVAQLALPFVTVDLASGRPGPGCSRGVLALDAIMAGCPVR